MTMRFLMKVEIPTAAENALAGDPKFNEKLQDLFLRLGAQATYTRTQGERRVDYVLVDIAAAQITAVAEPVFRLLKVKPEFLPEIVPQPYFGRAGY
jgi:hypothetical protein